MVDKYKVLISCKNDKTGKAYLIGDVITKKDFQVKVIKGWLAKEPPVLEEAIDGSDA